MDQAVIRFEDSPVLLPKRIQILRLEGRGADAQALVPKCKSYDIDELDRRLQEGSGVRRGIFGDDAARSWLAA